MDGIQGLALSIEDGHVMHASLPPALEVALHADDGRNSMRRQGKNALLEGSRHALIIDRIIHSKAIQALVALCL